MKRRSIHIHVDDALPPRTANTMSEAISISSPNGRVSQRSQKAAIERLGKALFGENGLQKPAVAQLAKKDALLRQARELREIAARGMNVRKCTAQAEKLEQEAAAAL